MLIIMMVVLIVYATLAWVGYTIVAGAGTQNPIQTPGAAYKNVTFPARGLSYEVDAFFQRGESDQPALINAHGFHQSRFSELSLARANAMFALGYTVLTIDLADNNGTTAGNGYISFGYSERYDVLGAFDYLITQGFAPDRIGLMGESMGAATSLLAAALDERIGSVWADSSYARADVALIEQAQSGGFPSFVIPGAMFIGWLRSGDRIWEANPINVAKSLASNRQAVSLVHCVLDGVVPPHHSNDLFEAYKLAGVPVTIWELPCVSHVGAFDSTPDNYIGRMNDFFQRSLAEDLS